VLRYGVAALHGPRDHGEGRRGQVGTGKIIVDPMLVQGAASKSVTRMGVFLVMLEKIK
jgi:hypothetical protein